MRKQLAVFGAFLIARGAWADDSGPRNEFLTSAGGTLGGVLRADLPDSATAFAPAFDGGIGMRFAPRFEGLLQYAHFFVGNSGHSATGTGLDQLGLEFRYSPVSFEGIFYGARAGWLAGTATPAFSISRAGLGGSVGCNFALGKSIDLRPLARLDLLPIEGSSGNQLWPVASLGFELVAHTPSVADFLTGLISGLIPSR